MIREATLADAVRLAELCADFFANGDYWGKRKTLAPDFFLEHAEKLIQSPIAAVLVAEESGTITGAIAVLLMPDIFTGALIVMKLHWIAKAPGLGLRLEKAAREWAKLNGASDLKMSAINDNSAALLERLGYERTEVIYSKSI